MEETGGRQDWIKRLLVVLLYLFLTYQTVDFMGLATEDYIDMRDKLSAKTIVGGKEVVSPFADSRALYAQTLPVRESTVDYCAWAEDAIELYGVDKAMARWEVICELFEAEYWWPAVVRRVKPVFVNACKRRNRLKEAAGQKLGQSVVVQTGSNPTAVEKAEGDVNVKGDWNDVHDNEKVFL